MRDWFDRTGRREESGFLLLTSGSHLSPYSISSLLPSLSCFVCTSLSSLSFLCHNGTGPSTVPPTSPPSSSGLPRLSSLSSSCYCRIASKPFTLVYVCWFVCVWGWRVLTLGKGQWMQIGWPQCLPFPLPACLHGVYFRGCFWLTIS